MRLRRIAPAFFQLIAFFLELEDLERLYATFDSKIQKLISRPGAIDRLYLRSTGFELQWERILLFRSVRNVRRLEVRSSIDRPTRFIPLLETLNPLEIVFKCRLSGSDLINLTSSYYSGSATESERRLARFWVPFQIPKFHRLAPRLELLQLGECLESIIYDLSASNTLRLPTPENAEVKPSKARYKLPPTLKSLTIDEAHVCFADLLPRLPATLLSLSVFYRDSSPLNLASIFRQLPQLEYLKIFTRQQLVWQPAEPTLTVPKTLTSLCLSVEQAADAQQLLEQLGSHLTCLSNIEVVALSTSPQAAVSLDLAKSLPPTISSLALLTGSNNSSQRPNYWDIITFPATLTSLSLTVTNAYYGILDLLASLQHLQQLSIGGIYGTIRIVGKGESLPSSMPHTERTLRIDTSRIPRSVTDLTIKDCYYAINTSAIESLPPNLSSLSLTTFSLKLFPTLRDLLPRCRLTILNGINLWDPDNGQKLRDWTFGMPWTSTVDIGPWSSAVLQRSSVHGLKFKATVSTNHNYYAPLVEHFRGDFTDASAAHLFKRAPRFYLELLDGLRNLKTLKVKSRIRDCRLCLSDLPPQLTHLELDDSRLLVLVGPTSSEHLKLVYIATNSTLRWLKPEWTLPSTVTHLDAPNWTIPGSTFAKWKLLNLEKLALRIEDIKDYEIPGMIEGKNLNAKTRSNMHLNISYGISGLLVPSKGIDELNWEIVVLHTEEWLERQFSRSLPRDSSYRIKTPATLGSTLTSCTWFDGGIYTALFFPKSARVIRMAPDIKWCIANRDKSVHQPDEIAVVNNMPDLKRLRYLEIENARWLDSLSDYLPSKLRFLKIITKKSFKLTCMPPHLEVLVIAQKFPWKPNASLKMSFALKSLPTSLRHLCIVGANVSLATSDYSEVQEEILPNLKTVFIGGPTLSTALALRQRLPVTSVDSFTMLLLPHYRVFGENARELGNFSEADATDIIESSPHPARFVPNVVAIDNELVDYMAHLEQKMREALYL